MLAPQKAAVISGSFISIEIYRSYGIKVLAEVILKISMVLPLVQIIRLLQQAARKAITVAMLGPSKGGEDMWIMQFNAATGALNWQKVYGGVGIEDQKVFL